MFSRLEDEKLEYNVDHCSEYVPTTVEVSGAPPSGSMTSMMVETVAVAESGIGLGVHVTL